MANQIIKARYKTKTDTEANWTKNDPVLLAGEMAISYDKDNKYKVGDGTSKWSALKYAKANLEKSDVITALGYTPPSKDTTYSTGTASTAGLTKLYTSTGTATDGTMTQAAIKTELDSKAPSSHTHNYAGSSSAGGSATSAVKLDTATAGSATQPVYFSGGKPVATTYTLGKSVPNNAVFTDTNTKVTSVGNHYTPSGGTTTSASGGSLTDITNSSSGVQVVTGITKDAAGHVTGVTSAALKSTNTNTTYTNFVKSGSGAKAGLVPAPSTTAGTTKYLREDGTWATPPDTNTTYNNFKVASSSGNGTAGLVPAPLKGTASLNTVGPLTVLTSTGGWTEIKSATTSKYGWMSSTDKSKLDGIASGANKYTLPTASSSTLGGVKTTSSVTSTNGLTACPIISGVPYYKDTNTTYELMSVTEFEALFK